MRSTVLALLVTVTPLAGCSTAVSTISARDRDVYAAVLDSMFARPNIGRIAQLVVRDSTSVHQRENLIAGVIEAFYDFPHVDSTAVRSFELRNRNSIAVPTIGKVSSNIPVVLVSGTVLRSLPRGVETYWRRFYELYPRSAGIISLSPIGYNLRGDVAILMVDQGCGGLCGNGYLVGMRFNRGRWYITKIHQTWIS